MQTVPNGASTPPSTSAPTTAQVHQGQLQDFELLLSVLREEVGSLAHFSQTLLRPRTFSPLDQENETGQDALQQLLDDPDYRALCKNNNVSPHYLIVTLKDGSFVYETSNREGENKTELTLTGNAKWQALRTRIEKSVTLLSGQIRYDRLVSAPRIATFYGMAPWDPTKPAEHQAAIDTLREKTASYQLGLEEDFNLLDLRPALTDEDRQVSFQGAPTADAQDEMQRQFVTGEIKRTVQMFLPAGVTSPLTHLANDILVSAEPERVRAQPTAYLKKILQSPEARKLGERLLSTMNWYGGKSGEETAAHIRTKVVANALQIWFKSQLIEYPDRIAGYELQSSSNWGKSYKTIWRDFENHLLTSKRATTEKEAIVMARLFLCQFPAEFRITDIPTDLPYRGSVVWVNFVNGVNLINLTDPEALHRQTFQKLVNLPLKLSEGATKEQLHNMSLARLLPTVDWAVTQGVIPKKQYKEYTQTETERAVSELDQYTNALNDALIELNKTAPSRLSIAKNVVENYLHVINFDNPLDNSFWNDHKLAKIPTGARVIPQQYVIDKYSIVDVVAEDKLGQPWSIFTNNGLLTEYSISLDENRQVQVGGSLFIIKECALPDVKEQFEKNFKSYMTSLTTAYETLIKSLLTSLSYSDRQALEWGKLSVYTLRKETYRVEAGRETPEIILPLRARNGLLLLTTYKGVTRTFELLPRAGIIRRINNLGLDLFGGILKYENWPIGMNSNSVEVLRHQTLPFDWKAHSTGSTPQNEANCEAIIEQLGHTFMAPTSSMENTDNVALTINSDRCREICNFIATQLLFVDPKSLRASAYGKTKFDSDEASQKRIDEVIKFFVPFWKSIEDISSDDIERRVNGAFGLSTDLVSFGLPIGRFASGSTKLLSNAGRLTVRTRLTAFATLTKEVSILALQALNPIDGVGQLLKALASRGLKLGRFGIFRIKAMAGKAGQYNFVQSLPQISNSDRWRPLASGDVLATVRGIDDVPVRKIASANSPHYRLIDPISGKPYGPALAAHSDELALGRSAYRPLEKTDQHSIVEVADNAKVREVLEVDGRTTLFIDDVAYQLDGDMLRRADKIDISDRLKALPCRVRRAPDEICLNSYVHRELAPIPELGSSDPLEDFCPWFGDRIYTPAPVTPRRSTPVLALDGQLYTGTDKQLKRFTGKRSDLGLPKKLLPKARIAATIEFQKGIYGRIKVTGVYEGLDDDIRQVSTLIIESKIDAKKEYLFTQLNANDYYYAEIVKGESLKGPHRLQRIPNDHLVSDPLYKELFTVFTGSLHANNTAAIYGVEKIKEAVRIMDEIAVPLGGLANPPETLTRVKVSTTPGQAVLFDHQTRMIVCKYPESTKTWTRSKEAPEPLRKRTAEIFNVLFEKPVFKPDEQSALQISKTMKELQTIVTKKGRPMNQPRNIAYAEITLPGGKSEVYVSVSGRGGDTGYLPIFAKNRKKEVNVGDTTYINVDHDKRFPVTSLDTVAGQLHAIPPTIKDISTYTPEFTARPVSLDSESKLIRIIRAKYPDDATRGPVTVVTTMAPCESCSVLLQQYAHTGGKAALKVIWD